MLVVVEDIRTFLTMKIEIYSDLICPWCYIGKRRMQAGLKLLGKEFNPKIVWRPFQLNPDKPIECMSQQGTANSGTVGVIGPRSSRQLGSGPGSAIDVSKLLFAAREPAQASRN